MRAADLRATPPPGEWGVGIDPAAIDRLAELWAGGAFPEPRWDYAGLPDGLSGAAWVDYCGLTISVMACLWPPEGEEVWGVRQDGDWLEDASALCWCFTRRLLSAAGLDLGFFRHWSQAEAEEHFRGRGCLQLVAERRRRLSAVAEAVVARWHGSFVHLAEEAAYHGPRTVELLAATVPGYRDEVQSAAGLLRFRKLAYLATAMMAARSGFAFSGIESFPVYPDYMLPRLLRHHGLLRYEPELAEAVDRRRMVPAGSRWELAIRWATVHAAERLRQRLEAGGTPVTGPALDYRLWHTAVLGPDAARLGEHHRTLTLDY